MVKIFGSRQLDFAVAVVENKFYPFRGVYTRNIPAGVLAVSHWKFMHEFKEEPAIEEFLVNFFTSPDIELLHPVD